MWLLCTTFGEVVRYAPLYTISVKLNTVSRCRAAVKYQFLESGAQLPSMERLRWHRYQAGLLQREVAELVGISRSVYVDMEEGTMDYWPKETVDKLAALFGVAPTDLLEGYQLFIYSGQRRNIEILRLTLGMKKRPFARYLGVNRTTLQGWITEKKRVSKKSWEKYFAEKKFT